MTPPRLVCLIGAECTGKTTLAHALAEHCHGLWVPEYLRTFCDAQGRTPTRDDQSLIIKVQIQQEAAALEAARAQGRQWVFCDTAPLLTAIYSDYVFGDTSLYVLARTLHARYALTLLMAPDIPWVADGLQRDGAHVRPTVHALLERELNHSHALWQPVAGVGDARRGAALKALTTLDVPKAPAAPEAPEPLH